MKSNWLTTRRFALAFFAAALIILSTALAAWADASHGRAITNLPDLTYVRKQVQSALAKPRFTPPGPAFKIAAARGKSLMYMPFASTIPQDINFSKALTPLAKSLGMSYSLYANNGTPSEWLQGLSQASARKVNVLFTGATTQVIQSAAGRARAAGVKVISARDLDESHKIPPNFAANVGAPVLRAARLEADYIIFKSSGKAHILVEGDNEEEVGVLIGKAIKTEFAKRCGPGCDVQLVSIPIAKWATEIQTQTRSSLLANPSTDYVLPIYDAMVQWVIPGLVSAGVSKKVKIVTFNGTPFVLDDIKNGSVEMDVGESAKWIAWSWMDEAGRVLTGHRPVIEHTPLRIYDSSNVRQAGSPPLPDNGFGPTAIFQSGYKKLWGLK